MYGLLSLVSKKKYISQVYSTKSCNDKCRDNKVLSIVEGACILSQPIFQFYLQKGTEVFYRALVPFRPSVSVVSA